MRYRHTFLLSSALLALPPIAGGCSDDDTSKADAGHKLDGGTKHDAAGVLDATKIDAPVDAAKPDAAKDTGTKPEAATNVDSGAPANPHATDVMTQHNDPARTGVNSGETCLTPTTAKQLTESTSFHVDGQVYGQPLVYTVGARRLLVVVTTTNVVAAFDLDGGGTPVWSLDATVLGTAGKVLRNVIGPLGILSTPVIDPVTGHLYFVARSCATATTNTNCPWTVHSVDVATGAPLDASVVKASFTNQDDGGVQPFDPDTEWNRPALLLQNGKLVLAWGVGQSANQHEEELAYHGVVLAYDAASLTTKPIVYVTTPRTRGGGIWQGGGGVVGDGTSVYFNSGNGLLTPNATKPSDFPTSPKDQENSLIQLKFDGETVKVSNYYDARPYHSDGTVFQYTNLYDYDMASAGPAFIPGTDDLVTGTKGGLVYLIDRTTMKERQEPLSPFTVLPLPSGQTLHIASDDDGPECVGSPTVWRRTTGGDDDAMVYLWPRHDRLTAFHYDHATSTMKVVANSAETAAEGGGMLSFSINGDAKDSAVLWAITSTGNQGVPAILRAYDPTSLAVLYTGNIPSYAKFVPPTISAGRVIVVSWPTSGGSDLLVFQPPGCAD